MKTQMSHSQLFALEEEKKKIKPKEEIVPIEFHKYLDTVDATPNGLAMNLPILHDISCISYKDL